MIVHFLKSDLHTYRVFWAILGALSCLLIPAAWLEKSGTLIILGGYFYLMFGVIPLNSLTGVTWRSQHIMSRNYLLSLPLSRKRLFMILQLRALAFCLPFLSFIAYAFLSARGTYFLDKGFPGLSYPGFLLISLLVTVWFINAMISMQLKWEQITGYLTLQQRTWAWVVTFFLWGLEGLAVLFLCYYAPIPATVRIFVLGVLTAMRMILARRRWLGT